MITFINQYQKGQRLSAGDPQSGVKEMNLTFSELEMLANRLQSEKAELLAIALHLSQAVTRMGNSAIGIDSYDQHNEAVAMAVKYQEDLQDWIVSNVSGS